MASEQTAPVDLDLLDDLRAKATPGEWRLEIDNVFSGPKSKSVYVADCEPMGGPHGGTRRGRANAALIVAAVNALPALIAELATLRDAARLGGEGVEGGDEIDRLTADRVP